MRSFNYIFYMVIFMLFIFCLQALISMAFQQKLTENLHECYLSNRVYYVASTLRGLSNADQVSFVLKTLGCVWWSYWRFILKGVIVLVWELGCAYLVLDSIWPFKLSSALISHCPNQFTYDLLQRITEDVQKFSSAISELFSYTFKPVLDIILFTRSLARTIG